MTLFLFNIFPIVYVFCVWYCLHVLGSFLDRDDKKRSVSMDVKAGRRGDAEDYTEAFSDVCRVL